MKFIKVALYFVLAAAVFLVPVEAKAIPQILSYQGKLNDRQGVSITGSKSIVFTIYDAASGGNALWSETQNVTIANGIMNVELGTVSSIPVSVFDADTTYLGIKIGSDSEMVPRQRITSGAYSFKAAVVNSVTGLSASAVTTNRVVLSWSAISGASSYTIERKSGTGQFASAGTSATNSFIDTNLAAGTSYTYRVRTTSEPSNSGITINATTASQGSQLNVLFIGNSLTYVNSVPTMLQTLVGDAGESRALTWDWVVLAGASLDVQWNNSSSPNAQSKIDAGPSAGNKWDVVVLQEYSVYPVCNQTSFETYATKFIDKIKSSNPNAQIILHENWAITDSSVINSNCSPISLYSSPLPVLVSETDAVADGSTPSSPRAKIVPVGQAWSDYGLNLLQTDGRHATPQGSYLAAATYYSLIYKNNPLGLTNNVLANTPGDVNDPNSLPTVAGTVSASDAQQLQAAAWKTYQAMDTKYKFP